MTRTFQRSKDRKSSLTRRQAHLLELAGRMEFERDELQRQLRAMTARAA